MKISVIYVDIESLFDLRQGVLGTSEADPDKVMEYLLSEEYSFRETDNLKFLEPGEYRKKMLDPSIAILETSTITRILISIKTKLESLEHRDKYYGEATAPEILLNIYPFKLTEEQGVRIRDLLFYKLEKCVKITVTSLPMSAVSPLFFKTTGVVSAFVYDVSSWMNEHLKTLEKTKIHDTILYFPPFYRELPTPEDLKTLTNLGFKDPISYTEYLLSNVATVSFLPSVFYSNVVTALAHLRRFDDNLKNNFTSPGDEKEYDDIISKIQVP